MKRIDMRTVKLPNGRSVVELPDGRSMPKMGQGTWYLGDDPDTRSQEIEALREGLRCGLTLIDTAEMYGGGRSERLVGEAISDCRDDVFLVSKVSPGSDRARTVTACEQSLERLGTDHLDLYLLHGVGNTGFGETIAAFEDLMADGRIRRFGVSNLDAAQMKRFYETAGGERTQVNQLLYNLNQRGTEWDLLPWLQQHGLAMMAYSPFDRAGLVKHDGLKQFAAARSITAGQAALAWLLDHDPVVPIPKASHTERAAENAGALDVDLTDDDRAELDRMFPPPTGPRPLQIY